MTAHRGAGDLGARTPTKEPQTLDRSLHWRLNAFDLWAVRGSMKPQTAKQAFPNAIRQGKAVQRNFVRTGRRTMPYHQNVDAGGRRQVLERRPAGPAGTINAEQISREGDKVARCTVERLMRRMGLRGVERSRSCAPPRQRCWSAR